MLWTILCYVSPAGNDMIAQWYDVQTAEVQTALDTTLEYLSQRERQDWQRPEFAPLKDGICELRFKANGVQYRPLGFFGPGRGEFTLLIGASKKGNSWKPKDALETAKKRKREIEADRRRCGAYPF